MIHKNRKIAMQDKDIWIATSDVPKKLQRKPLMI